MHDALGETDDTKRVIRINKEAHNPKKYKEFNIPKEDQSLANTIVHELLHKKDMTMSEKEVSNKARSLVKTMGIKAKQKLYAKFT